MWAEATQLMGMSDEEFWNLTREEFVARREVWNEHQRRWDERFGLIASTYWNFKVDRNYQRTPGSFFGYEDPEEYEMTVEESIAQAKRFANAHNASIN